MTRVRSSIVLLTALTLVLAACGDDGAATTASAEPGTTTAPSTTTTAAPITTTTATAPSTTATTAPVPVALPPTGVIGVVDRPYKWGEEQGEATAEELPFPLDRIEAHWFQAGEVYAVAYVGLDLEQTGPLCPGNSIVGGDGLAMHVSNSPTPGGVCGEGIHVAVPPGGVRVCDGLVLYVTEIPNGTLGRLYASIEWYPGTGTHYGATAVVDADPDYMAAVDPALLDCD